MFSHWQRLSIEIFWTWSSYILMPRPFLSYHGGYKIHLIGAETFLSFSLFLVIDLEALHHLGCSQAESHIGNKDKKFLFVTKAKYNHDGMHEYILYLETMSLYHSQQMGLNIFGILQARFYCCFQMCQYLLLYHHWSLIDQVCCGSCWRCCSYSHTRVK